MIVNCSDPDEPVEVNQLIQVGTLKGFLLDFKIWGIQYNISRIAISSLLKILRKHFGNFRDSFAFDLPMDSRTIYKISEKILVQQVSGQRYIFFEPINILKKLFAEYRKKIGPVPEMLWLSLNIDGVSPFKNAKENHGFWSILAKIKGLRGNIVFPLAMCYGKGKPVSLEFMKESMQALQSLFDTGLEGTTFYPKLICCDLPAKAYVKITKCFNAKLGCDRCEISGDWCPISHTTLFKTPLNPLRMPKLRTNEEFRRNAANNQKRSSSVTPLTILRNIDLVKDVNVDVMHGAFIGVVISIWVNGNNVFPKFPEALLQNINSKIDIFNKYVVNKCFDHKPKYITDYKNFKGDDFRIFLLYAAPFVLQDIPPDQFNSFMCLHQGISLLENQTYIDRYSEYAHKLFHSFLIQSEYMYGASILTYNFHGILHYAEDAVRHGPLTANGAFCFESFNAKFCRFIKSRTYPLTEFAKRYYETINVSFFCFSPIRVIIKTFVIERNLIEIIDNGDDDIVQCKVYLQAKDVYNSYCNSLLLSIMQFEQNNFRIVGINKNRLSKQCLKIEHQNIVTCIPLLHTM